MNMFFALTVALLATFLLVCIFFVWNTIYQANPHEAARLKEKQGSFVNVLSGSLRNPSTRPDYEEKRGLAFDGKKKVYVKQSALSNEALKSVYLHR